MIKKNNQIKSKIEKFTSWKEKSTVRKTYSDYLMHYFVSYQVVSVFVYNLLSYEQLQRAPPPLTASLH